MPTAVELLLEEYEQDLETLVNANIDSTTTNPNFVQDTDFPGPFIEENSPVKDIYEYEKILNEESNEATNSTTTNNNTTGSETTYSS
tara:strand:- start:701 stop:961 length:261 start_codon:yes stop_codon:yes gene_type:complete